MGRERRKWTPEEDSLLRGVVNKGKSPPDASNFTPMLHRPLCKVAF